MELPIASNCNILGADKNGKMAVVECSPFTKRVREAVNLDNGKIVCTVNSFTSDEMKPYDAANGNDYHSNRRYQVVMDTYGDVLVKCEDYRCGVFFVLLDRGSLFFWLYPAFVICIQIDGERGWDDLTVFIVTFDISSDCLSEFGNQLLMLEIWWCHGVELTVNPFGTFAVWEGPVVIVLTVLAEGRLYHPGVPVKVIYAKKSFLRKQGWLFHLCT